MTAAAAEAAGLRADDVELRSLTLKGKSEPVQAYSLSVDDQIGRGCPDDGTSRTLQPWSSAGVLVRVTISPFRKTRTLTVFPMTSPAIRR